jgi:glycosyltransferase involved in cell wall biosynthesis
VKLLVLSRYDQLGASSRVRSMQYFEALAQSGIEVRFEPFFRDRYLERLYTSQSTLSEAVRAYANRLRRLLFADSPDAIWLEKEALPWLPHCVERILLPRGVPVVSDYDDAVFHRYDLHRSAIVRRLLGKKIDRVMAASALVMAGNQYLADRAREAGARRVEFVPTVVDLDVYQLRDDSADTAGKTIGWIGSPSTWREYMAPLMPMLSQLAADGGARILAVGAADDVSAHPNLDSVAWTEDTEVARIQEMDIGIMPLTDTPWARGKCGYKLIQYMACGLPVVASPVGVNAEIVEHGVNGFLVETEEQWRDALLTLLRDPDLRRRMGQQGRKKVEAQYSLQVWGPRVASMIKDVAEKGGRCSI